jgi:outer membrane protein TolC
LASQLVAGYYGTLAAQKQLISLKEAVLRLELIKNIAKSRYANNAAAYVEFLNAQVAQSSAEADRFAMEKQLQVSLSNIKTLIGRNPREKIILTGEINLDHVAAPTLVELEDHVENNHPLLQSSRFQLEAAQKAVTLAKMAYLPDFQIIATSNTNNAPLSSGSSRLNYQFELDVVIPLFFFTKERYGVEQALRNQYATQAADISARQQLILAVQTAHANYEQARSQYQFLVDRQLPEAEAAYKLALNSYANAGIGFNDLLTAQGQLRSLQVSLAVAQSNLLQSYAALMAAAGKEPI